jgi:hypothetical protein
VYGALGEKALGDIEATGELAMEPYTIVFVIGLGGQTFERETPNSK